MTLNGERACGLHLRVWLANKQSLWMVNGGPRKRLVPPSGQLHSRSPGKPLRPTVFLSPHNKPLLLFPGKPSPRRPGCHSNTHGLVWCVVSTVKVGQLGAREQVNSTGQNQHSGPRCCTLVWGGIERRGLGGRGSRRRRAEESRHCSSEVLCSRPE